MIFEQIKHSIYLGLSLTMFGYTSINLLTLIFNFNPYIANLFVYFIGVFISYWINAKFIFNNNIELHSLIKFIFSFLIAYLANLIALYFSLHILKLNNWFAQLISLITYSCIHFLINRQYSFRN